MSILVWPQANHDSFGTCRTDDVSISNSIASEMVEWDHYQFAGTLNHGSQYSLISYYDSSNFSSTIFAGTSSGIYKLSCNELTKTLTPNGIIYNPGNTLPFTYNNGFLYVASGNAIQKIDENGTVLQTFENPGGVEPLSISATSNSSPIIGPDGVLYMAGAYYTLLMTGRRSVCLMKYNMSTGGKQWRTTIRAGGATCGDNGASLLKSCMVFDSSDYDIIYLLTYNVYLSGVSCTLTWENRIDKIRASDGSIISSRSLSHDFSGMTFNKTGSTKRIYVSSNTGLYVYNEVLDPPIAQHVSSGCNSSPSQGIDGTIYYRAGRYLYAVNPNGTEKWKYSNLPETPIDATYAAPIIDKDGNIIVCNDSGKSIAVTILQDTGTFPNLLETLSTQFNGDAVLTPTIGGYNLNSGPLYFATQNSPVLYIYGSPTPQTTTTTTLPPTTTTTTTTGTGTTTTTTTTSTPTTTTTTTTTTPAPLKIVQTVLYEEGIPIEVINASDSTETENNPLSQAFNYGTIAPNETSRTMVISLNIPHAKAITNIKLGLVSTGGIEFANDLFGISNSIELRDDITPDNHFQGINTSKESTSPYNISIPNKDNHTSEYVYLNVKLPKDQTIGEGIIRLKWFFDYAE